VALEDGLTQIVWTDDLSDVSVEQMDNFSGIPLISKQLDNKEKFLQYLEKRYERIFLKEKKQEWEKSSKI